MTYYNTVAPYFKIFFLCITQAAMGHFCFRLQIRCFGVLYRLFVVAFQHHAVKGEQ